MKFDVSVYVESYVNIEVEADSIDDAEEIAMSDLILSVDCDNNEIISEETYVKNVISVSELD